MQTARKKNQCDPHNSLQLNFLQAAKRDFMKVKGPR